MFATSARSASRHLSPFGKDTHPQQHLEDFCRALQSDFDFAAQRTLNDSSTRPMDRIGALYRIGREIRGQTAD